jgi:hypothetical protein
VYDEFLALRGDQRHHFWGKNAKENRPERVKRFVPEPLSEGAVVLEEGDHPMGEGKEEEEEEEEELPDEDTILSYTPYKPTKKVRGRLLLLLWVVVL